MGCINANISKVGSGVRGGVEVVSNTLTATVSKLDGGLKANIGIVCTSPSPNLYTRVEYIESNGVQYIDTGIMLTTKTDYLFVGAITENTKTGWIAGAPTWIGIHKKANQVAVTQTSNGMMYMPVEVNKVFSIGLYGDKVYFNNVETNKLTRRNATKSLFLFAYHHTNDTGSIHSSNRMYSFTIWEDGVLVRDFIPVLDLDGVACMYDMVSKTFFYNQGKGDFIAGNKIE